MKYKFPIVLLIISILGCDNQNSQAITADETRKEQFVWDFNSENIYVYSFEQVTNSVNDWSGFVEHIDTSESVARGELKVKSKGNDKADFVLVLSIEDEAFQSFKEGIPPQTMVIPDMDANGQPESKKRNSDVMFDLIFPLPSKDLKIGGSDELNMEIPFNLMGSPLYVKGYNKLTYLKDTAPNVALIRSEFKVDELDVPAEIKGEFMCSFSGEAEFEFNYKKHYFESADIDLYIKMKSKFAKGDDAMGRMDMMMESKSKYDIKFIEVE